MRIGVPFVIMLTIFVEISGGKEGNVSLDLEAFINDTHSKTWVAVKDVDKQSVLGVLSPIGAPVQADNMSTMYKAQLKQVCIPPIMFIYVIYHDVYCMYIGCILQFL